MRVEQSGRFKRSLKRLHPNEKDLLDQAVKQVVSNFGSGDLKKGDLAGVRVYKFKVNGHLKLLVGADLKLTICAD